MAKIESKTLRAECERICKMKQWEKGANWDSEDSAIAIIRTIFAETDPEMLKPEQAETRKELVKIIKPLMTAAVNFRREYLVAEKLAPEIGKVSQAAKEYC